MRRGFQCDVNIHMSTMYFTDGGKDPCLETKKVSRLRLVLCA
jgi:hypothetical protein